MYSQVRTGIIVFKFIVELLAGVWKTQSTFDSVECTVFTLSECKEFVSKYDEVQRQLELLAAKDDLLAGIY